MSWSKNMILFWNLNDIFSYKCLDYHKSKRESEEQWNCSFIDWEKSTIICLTKRCPLKICLLVKIETLLISVAYLSKKELANIFLFIQLQSIKWCKKAMNEYELKLSVENIGCEYEFKLSVENVMYRLRLFKNVILGNVLMSTSKLCTNGSFPRQVLFTVVASTQTGHTARGDSVLVTSPARGTMQMRHKQH